MVPSRKQIFVYTKACARTGTRRKEGGEPSKMLGYRSRDVLDEAGKMLRLAEHGNILNSLLFRNPKSGYLTCSKAPSATRAEPALTTSDVTGGLSTGPLRQVRSPAFMSAESHDNLVYTTASTPGRSGLNKRNHGSYSEDSRPTAVRGPDH